MSAPSVPRAGRRRELMPAPHQMLTVHQAQDALADVEERVIRGENVDPAEWAAAEAAVHLAAKQGEIEERVRRRARQQGLEAAAAEGEAWFAGEAPVLASAVLEAMAAAVEAIRPLVAAVADYQRGADVAAAKIRRLRHPPTDWPAGKVLEKVLAEVAAEASGRVPSGLSTPVSEQFRRAVAARVGSGLLSGPGGTGEV